MQPGGDLAEPGRSGLFSDAGGNVRIIVRSVVQTHVVIACYLIAVLLANDLSAQTPSELSPLFTAEDIEGLQNGTGERDVALYGPNGNQWARGKIAYVAAWEKNVFGFKKTPPPMSPPTVRFGTTVS